MTDTNYWGYHLILDVRSCDKDKVQDDTYLAKWVSDLVKEIDMVAYGDPQIIHFGKNDPKLAGWTVLQFIETSNITAHFCDAEGDAYIDVFSCKYFDKDVVERHFKKWFSPKRIRSTLLTRCAS